MPAKHSMNRDLTGHLDATFEGLFEDALNALDEDMIATRLNLVLTFCISLDISVINESFGFEFKTGLRLGWMVCELDVLKVQLATHHVWDVIDDLASCDSVVLAYHVESLVEELVEEVSEEFLSLVFDFSHIFKLYRSS